MLVFVSGSIISSFVYCFLCHLQVKEQICRLIQTGVESGAKLVLDGRNIVVIFELHLILHHVNRWNLTVFFFPEVQS